RRCAHAGAARDHDRPAKPARTPAGGQRRGGNGLARSSHLPRGVDPAADTAGLRIADDHQRAHVRHLGRCLVQSDCLDPLVHGADGAREDDEAFAAAGLLQQRERAGKSLRPARRARIVHRDGEIGLRGETQPRLDRRPWLEIVGEIDGAEIMAERRMMSIRRFLTRSGERLPDSRPKHK
ncbi:hypothetical protein KXV85_003867, partial [Aspergillus fumigatus]